MGRATVFMVGLDVILALILGIASTALGANGKPFVLGKENLATAVSTLVKNGAGPTLDLRVDSGAPLAVNSSEKVANLNADRLDGLDSTAFLHATHSMTHTFEYYYPVVPATVAPSSISATRRTGASKQAPCPWPSRTATSRAA